MKPIEFKQQNVVFAKNQPPYLPLPAYQDNEQGGRIFHCWKLSLRERIKILVTGKLWLNVLNFNQPPQRGEEKRIDDEVLSKMRIYGYALEEIKKALDYCSQVNYNLKGE